MPSGIIVDSINFMNPNLRIIDQENKEYFSDTYGITNIHPLLVDHCGMTIMFLDDRGILFVWCEMTQSMYCISWGLT